jgi:hypothetical protein
VFVLSLAGQGFAHLYVHKMPPAAVVVFVSALPVIVLALIAVLIHKRQIDRAEAAEAEGGVAEQTELAAVRVELSEAREAARTMQDSLNAARAETAEAVVKAEALAQKLASTAKPKTPRRSTRKQDRGSGAAVPAGSTERTFGDLLKEARAYRDELAKAGERVSKDKLRLRLTIGSSKALDVLQALENEGHTETSEEVV